MPRLGIVASKKLGDAVARNRAKRLIREVFRLNTPRAARRRPRRDPAARAVRRVLSRPRRRLPRPPARRARQPRPGSPGSDSMSRPRSHGRAARAPRALRGYQLLFSPLFAGSCRFLPSCSEYTRRSHRASRRPSGERGWRPRRLARCHPFGGHGVDPVPADRHAPELRWKSEFCWPSLLSFLVLYGYQACSRRRSRLASASSAPRASGAARGRPPTTPASATGAGCRLQPPRPRSRWFATTAEHDIVVENDEVRGVLDARGRPQELAAQALPDPEASRSISSPNVRRPARPGRSRCPSTIAAHRPRSRSALFKPSADAVTRLGSGEPCLRVQRRVRPSARKDFSFAPDAAVHHRHSAPSVAGRRRALNPHDPVGARLAPAWSRAASPTGRRRSRSSTATRRDAHRGSATSLSSAIRGDHRVRRRRRSLLPERGASGGQPRARQLRRRCPFRSQGTDTSLQLRVLAASTDARHHGAVLLRAQGLRRARAASTDLVRAIHFGIFGFLAAPLLRALKWVNGYVGNYGWSIIMLTMLINVAMFPLRHKSVVSMRKMQEIQPEVKAIQDRYAKLKMTDPARQKMNVELMNLYRERGVNPASGCMPMLLTMPVLFAFYACCRWRSRSAARRSSGGSRISRRTIRCSSRRC